MPIGNRKMSRMSLPAKPMPAISENPDEKISKKVPPPSARRSSFFPSRFELAPILEDLKIEKTEKKLEKIEKEDPTVEEIKKASGLKTSESSEDFEEKKDEKEEEEEVKII
ncbi:unnamed protein product [Caenorhabditis nigoni]